MSKNIRFLFYVMLLSSAFIYGYLFGVHKVFPFNQLMAVKHYIEVKLSTFETIEGGDEITVEVHNTFLNRLLIKKVQLGQNIGSGGGISISDHILYVVTNKGRVFAYDIQNQVQVNTDLVQDVPLNFNEFLVSGHPYKNNFRIAWFRVNGVYSELSESGGHTLFISHNRYDAENDCITHNVSRLNLEVRQGAVESRSGWQTIFTASPCIDPLPEHWLASSPYSGHISGGKIVHFDENTLLITVGDYNKHGLNNAELWAMDSSNPYGKFILLDKESGDWSIFAKGTRNPSGLHIDQTGIIWSVENGPLGGDELNIIEPGNNYGWPMVSYGLWYDLDYELPGDIQRGSHDEFITPIFAWAQAVAPSGLIRIEGSKFELWQGDLIVTTMRNQSLRRLRLDHENRVAYDEQIDLGHRIRDIATLPNDSIVLFTDDGYLIFIDDGGALYNNMGSVEIERMARLNDFDNLMSEDFKNSENALAGITAKSIFDYNCSVCHGSNTSAIGPHLNNLFNRQVGELETFNYTETLRSDRRLWTPELLKSFLLNPDSEFAGSSMPTSNLNSAEADSIIRYIETL